MSDNDEYLWLCAPLGREGKGESSSDTSRNAIVRRSLAHIGWSTGRATHEADEEEISEDYSTTTDEDDPFWHLDRYGCCSNGPPDWWEKSVVKDAKKARRKYTAMGRGKGTRRRHGRANQTNSSDPDSRRNVVKIRRELEESGRRTACHCSGGEAETRIHAQVDGRPWPRATFSSAVE